MADGENYNLNGQYFVHWWLMASTLYTDDYNT